MKKYLREIFVILAVIATFIGGFIALLYGFLWLYQGYWWLVDNVFIEVNNFLGFIGIIFLISAFIFTIQQNLKDNKKVLNRKNIISETRTQSLILVLNIAVIALAIYLINLWYGFIFIFLILGFLYTFTKSFRGK